MCNQQGGEQLDTGHQLAGTTAAVCEDEAATILQVKSILEREGLRVVSISTMGYGAIDSILRERPDVVLMDIKLPDLDGIEATRRILETYHSYQPVVIMVTAYGDEAHRQRAVEAGARGYLTKPFTAQELIRELHKALEEDPGKPAMPHLAD